MAKIVNDVDVLNITKKDYLDQTLTKYSSFLNQIPNYVDYLSIDYVNSINDVSLHNIEELLGNDSPIKYDRITNFPLYNFERIEISSQFPDPEVIGNAIVLPDIHKPEIDDLFIINGLTRELFRINKIDIEMFHGKTFYKISFYLYTLTNSVDIETQINDEFETVTTFNLDEITIIKKTTADDILILERFSHSVKNYLRNFYDTRISSYIFKFLDSNFTLYDHRMQYFIQKNNLFSNTNAYRNELFFNLLDYNFYSETNYSKKSLIYAIENKDITKLEGTGIELTGLASGISNPYSGFYIESVFEPVQTVVNEDTPLYKLTHKNFLDYFNDEAQPEMNEIYASIINNYIKDNLTITNLIESINNVDFNGSFEDYYFLPMILYIIKKTIILETAKNKL